MVAVARMMVAMLWKNRVPRGRVNDQAAMAIVERIMIAKTAHSQSEPPAVMLRPASGGL